MHGEEERGEKDICSSYMYTYADASLCGMWHVHYPFLKDMYIYIYIRALLKKEVLFLPATLHSQIGVSTYQHLAILQ